MDLKPLTDEVLIAQLEALVFEERENVADIVAHLAEVDHREIAIDRGFPTLFDYCRRKLNYSEAGAFLRIRAARASAAFPRVLDDLRSGKIHLDSIMRLYPHLNEQNSDQLLDLAAGASKREVMSLVARLDDGAPAPERDVIRPLPARDRESRGSETLSPRVPEVLTPSRVRLAFTADNDFLLMVERLRSLRRHKFPAGRLEDLLKEAVAAFLGKIEPSPRRALEISGQAFRKSLPSTEAPFSVKRSRRIPAKVKRLVWNRDGGQCAYVAEDGRRCENRDFLEYDHITPWAIGGRSDTADNIRVLCRPHNQRLARRRFGPRCREDRELVRPDAVEHGSGGTGTPLEPTPDAARISDAAAAD